MVDESKLPTIFRKKLPPFLEKIKNGHYNPEDQDYPVHYYLQETDIRMEENGSEIIQFLKGKCILITGVTGFLGKLLLEKLLRCSKDIDTIYVIVRTKKGKDPQVRVNELLDGWAFIKLADIFPDFRKKVVGITGDFEEPGLGLSEESKQLIANRVNIIYHLAATVRFDESLKKAVTINTKGTLEMMKLAKLCKKLDVFTYVSTAYANCNRKKIDEKIYEPLMDSDVLIYLTDNLSNEMLDKITPGILGEMPNTYVFTKQISESIVKQESEGLVVCIQRPSVVMPAVEEPIRSWVDTIFGPSSIMIGTALGFIHITFGNPNYRTDFIPADYVINNCIAASHETAKQGVKSEIKIFNCTPSRKNPLKWYHLSLVEKPALKLGSTKSIWKHFSAQISNIYLFHFLFYLLHTIPAIIADFFAVRFGYKPIFKALSQKAKKFLIIFQYFIVREWEFEYSNSIALRNSLNKVDKKNFKFNTDDIDWISYFTALAVGHRELLIHDYLDTLEKGRTWLKLVTLAHYIFMVIILGTTSYFFLNTIFCFIPLGIITFTLYSYITTIRYNKYEKPV